MANKTKYENKAHKVEDIDVKVEVVKEEKCSKKSSKCSWDDIWNYAKENNVTFATASKHCEENCK